MPPLSVTWLVLGTLALIGLVGIIIIRARNSSNQDDTTASDKDYESHEDVVCRMVNLRRRHDKRIKKEPNARNWMMWQLWESPEGYLLRCITDVLWLQDGGMTPTEAWTKICPGATGQIAAASDEAEILRVGVRRILTVIDPPYLDLGQSVIDKVSAIAELHGGKELAAYQAGKPYPSVEWLTQKSSFEEFEAKHFNERTMQGPVTKTWFQATNFRDRFLPTDEVWLYDSPASYWQNLGGRAGFALVRQGRPITYTTTKMN